MRQPARYVPMAIMQICEHHGPEQVDSVQVLLIEKHPGKNDLVATIPVDADDLPGLPLMS